MKNILISGIGGFSGSHLSEYLLKKGKYNVFGTIRGRCRQTNFIDHIKDKLTLLECDLTDYNSVQATIEDSEPDIIFHLGAQSVSDKTLIPIMKSHKICIEKISDLFDGYSSRYNKKIININGIETEVVNIKGNQLKTMGYWNGMGTWFPIKQISRHKYKGKTIRLIQKWGQIEVTPNHSIYNSIGQLVKAESNQEMLAIRQYNSMTKEIDRLRLRKFKFKTDGMWIWHKKTPHIKLKILLTDNDIKSFLRFAGAYISEGCLSELDRNRKTIIISSSNLSWIKNIKSDISNFFTGTGHISTQKKLRKETYKTMYNLSYSSNVFGTTVKYLFGKYAKNKKMPDTFLKLTKELREIFLTTLFEGDGSEKKYQKFTNMSYATTSEMLIAQLCFLFLIDNRYYTFSTRKQKKNQIYRIREVRHFNPFDTKKKIEYIDYDGYVYDISVDKIENFTTALGFVVAHNTFIPTSWRAPQETLNTNILGTLNLLESVRKSKYDPKILITSSSEVYGMVMDNELPIKESNALRPMSPYSVSKCAQDLLGYQYHMSYGLKIIRTRAFNLMGPRSGEKIFTASFSKQIAEIEKGIKEPIINVGNLEAIRDLNDVRDIVRAYDLAVEKCDYGEVYNVCSGIGWKVNTILNMLLNMSNSKIEIKQDKDRMRPSDVHVLIGDSSKFRKKTGWQDQVPIQTSLKDILTYWRNK